RQTIEQDLPLLVLVEARNQVGQGRLAATGAPNQRHHLPRLGGEADVAEHRLVAARVAEVQVAHLKPPTHPLALLGAAIRLGRLVQLLEDALGAGQALLDGRTDYRQLTNRLGQQAGGGDRSEEHTSELQSRENLVCRLLLEKKKC